MKKLSVLMPVYNEAKTLATIIERVLKAPIDLEIEILVVDDASTDGSSEILADMAQQDGRVQFARHAANRGKGAAIRTAIEMMSGDVVIIQDSDLEYDPADYPRLLNPILDGRADAVFGSRFASSPERRVLLYWHSLGNKVLTWLTNMLNDLNLTDMETGYKAVSADVLRSLRLQSERFGIEPEMTTRLAQWGARIYEVPISYNGRTYSEGKHIGWRDGVQAIWLLFRYRWFDTRFSNRYGSEAFERLSLHPAVSQWLLGPMASHLGGRILEASAGSGNLTRHLLTKERLVAIEEDRFYARALDRRIGYLANVSVIEGRLEDSCLYDALIDENLDSILCVNVLAHLAQPVNAVSGFARVLRPGGRLVALVPAHPRLFSEADRAIGRRKRFEEPELRVLFESQGFAIDRLVQFNRFGFIAWMVGRFLGQPMIWTWQARSFRFVLPIARRLERFSALPGLSWVIVGTKK